MNHLRFILAIGLLVVSALALLAGMWIAVAVFWFGFGIAWALRAALEDSDH